METTIPVYNLYYLLCYAWDRLDELDLVDVNASEPPRDTLNLLGRVLANGVKALMRRGFERGYREQREELAGIRGRIAMAPTLRKQLWRYGRAECVFDELDHDTPANRIIRATLTVLLGSELVEDRLRHEVTALHRHFRDVKEVRSSVTDCRRVVIHRNNRHYGFLLDICSLILGMELPDETGEGTKFRDFSRDHRAMAKLFEQFVRNFYEYHSEECGLTEVTSKTIQWNGSPVDEESRRLWPGMHSDICLQRHGTPVVVDCKFYTDVVKENLYGGELISSSNLYQIFTYTENLAAVPGWEAVEGLLIYAQSGEPVDIAHTACGRLLRAATVNLNEPDWKSIHKRLVGLVQASN